MKMITSFDPSAATSGNFDHQVANPCGGVYLFNESDTWLQLTLPDGGIVGLPAWWARFYYLNNNKGKIEWKALATINSVARPLSRVYGESYERNEIVGRTFYDGPIPRNPFIANSVSSTVSTNQVINDGNPTITTVVEATQSGNSSGSNLFMGNDGSAFFAQFVSSVYTKLFDIVPGASPLIKLGKSIIMQGADSTGAFANIFGVDGGKNTFLQAHTGNDQIVLYDKDGNAIATFGGTNQNLNVVGTTQTVNGDTSGTAQLIEGIIGPYKLILYIQNNYRQAGTGQNISMKTPFTSMAFIGNMGAGGVQLKQSGTAQTLQIVTAIASGGGSSTPVTAINTSSIGWLTTNFNQVADGGAMGSARTGLVFAWGI